jgi:hypothetical protein
MPRFGAVLLALLTTLALNTRIVADEGEKGPHGGILYEGAKHKYHIELKVDASTKTATAYILDNKAKNAVPIKAKSISIKIKGVKEPVTLTGATQKDASDLFTMFQGKNDRFGAKLDFMAIQITAKVEDDKPAFTFDPEE